MKRVKLEVRPYECPECCDRGTVYVSRRRYDGHKGRTYGRYPCLSCAAGRARMNDGPQVFRFGLPPTYSYPEVVRPRTRADCLPGGCNEARPCPFVGCAHHLYLDVVGVNGALRISQPLVDVWDLPETCALDVADRGGATLEEVGVLNNVTRERARQVETCALAKVRARAAELRGDVPDLLPALKVLK